MNQVKRRVSFKRSLLSIISIILVIAWLGTGCASSREGGLDSAKIVFEDNAKQISTERMMTTVNTLAASDEGRISGFENEAQAGQYIEKAFQEMGLSVSTQEFPIQAYQCTNFKISIDTGSPKELIDAMVLNYSGSTPKAGLKAEIVFVGLGAGSDFSGQEVSGKFVLIQRGGELFRTKVARAAEAGAAGAIFYDPNGQGAISATLGELSPIPAVCIAPEDAQLILERLGSKMTATADVTVDCISEAGISKNIIGLLKGSQNNSGKTLVVGAHYDGVNTQGANDNASGVAAVIEMARVISEEKIPLKCDIQFVAFGAEEIGLLGSIAYVDQMFAGNNNKPIAMLNFDMVGSGDTVRFYTATGQGTSSLTDLTAAAVEQFGYANETGEMDNSDHVPFAMSGVPSLLFENGPYEGYHTINDRTEFVEPEALARAANLGIALCVEIGKNPEEIE